MDQRALPVPEDPERPRGRHEAPRGSVGGPAGAAIGIVVAAVVVAGVLATWLISSAKEAPEQSAAAGAATTTRAAPPHGRPAGGVRQPGRQLELRAGPDRLAGAGRGQRQPGAAGRTSGSSALVRARGPEPGQVGLALPEVVATVERGQRYVASAWVRSSASGQQVTVRLVGAAGKEVSKKTASTLPGLEWRRVIVSHTVAGAGPLRLEIVADGVPAGDALLVDEVVVRLG